MTISNRVSGLIISGYFCLVGAETAWASERSGLGLTLQAYAHRDAAVFESQRLWHNGNPYRVANYFSQSQSLDLLYTHGNGHAFTLEIPYRYQYGELAPPRPEQPEQEVNPSAAVGFNQIMDAWTLGDLGLRWLIPFPGSWHSHTQGIVGLSLPTATPATGAYTLSDLEGLPRGGKVDQGQGLDGAHGLRAVLGLAHRRTLGVPEKEFKNEVSRAASLHLRSTIRQPLAIDAQSPRNPYTLADFHASLTFPILYPLGLTLSGGQTRAWFPVSLLSLTAPSASYMQASLDLHWRTGVHLALGGRWNPLWKEEYEPLRISLDSHSLVSVKVLSEPQAQAFFALGFQWEKKNPLPPRPIDGSKIRHPKAKSDRDGDGLGDAQDYCPELAEDRDGYWDGDGCPDEDNDRDGRADGSDLCPNEAEDKDGHNDGDGCPDLDNDQDGIPDGLDACPMTKEIVNFFHDEDGCPDEKPDRVSATDLESLRFQAGSVYPDSTYLGSIDSLAKRMQSYPGTRLKVVGHADAQEANAAVLSLSRAMAIIRLLELRGVEKRRMEGVGLGATRILDYRKTASGRAKNRRITLDPR